MKLRPLNDGGVIKQLEAKEKTAGGIFLPEAAKEKPQIGKVVAVGPGKILDDGKVKKMSVKVDDEVIYGKYMGSEVEIADEKYVIINESDILGKDIAHRGVVIGTDSTYFGDIVMAFYRHTGRGNKIGNDG